MCSLCIYVVEAGNRYGVLCKNDEQILERKNWKLSSLSKMF